MNIKNHLKLSLISVLALSPWKSLAFVADLSILEMKRTGPIIGAEEVREDVYRLKSLLFPDLQNTTSLDKAYGRFFEMSEGLAEEAAIDEEFERVLDVLIEKNLIEINDNEILSKIYSMF